MRILIILSSLLFATGIYAQNTSGRIVYKEIIEVQMDTLITGALEDTLSTPQMEGLNEVLEQFSMPEIKRELRFTSTASSFKVATKSKDKQMTSEDGSESFHFVMMVPEEELYIDMKTLKVTEQKEFMGKKFLLNYEIEKQDWKITGKQKKVADKLCFEARLKGDTNQTIAWFCPEIQVASGPDVYGQLPGIILELTTKKGELTYKAIEIELNPDEDIELEAPKKGKKVSKEKYRKIVEEKTREMKEVNGGQMVIEIKSF